jgi:heme A synthase
MEWYWEKQEGGEKTNDANLKLPETITPSTEERLNPADATENEANWRNTGERRRNGATLDLTEF